MSFDHHGQAERTQTSAARRLASLDHVLGVDIARELRNPAVTDIHVNEDGAIRVVEHGAGGRILGEISAARAESVIRLLASHMDSAATREHPTISGVLPGTTVRFQGVLPPVSRRPIFALRKAAEVIFTLDDFVHQRVLSQAAARVIREAIVNRDNLIIAGGTGSGKTTFAGACLAEPAMTQDRVVIIEDTRELQCHAPDRIELLTPPLVPTITMDDLVRTTLRLFPGRIVIGEVRGPEALTLVKAWGTGHPGGLCTLHANGPRDALYRLEDLIREVAVTIPRRSIANAIGLVVYIERGPFNKAYRRVTSMVRPYLGPDGDYEFEDIDVQFSALEQMAHLSETTHA